MVSYLQILIRGFAFFLCIESSTASADPWESCPLGEGPAVQVLSCYGAGSQPFPDCPTGTVVAHDDLALLVEAAYPNGQACEQSGYTIDSNAYTIDDASQFGYFKRCKNGAAVGAQPGILGAKVCSVGAVCPQQAGDRLTASAVLVVENPDDRYCLNHCEVAVRGLGLTFGPGAQEQEPLFYEVIATTCSVPGRAPPSPPAPEFCWEKNGQTLCLIGGVVGVMVNDAIIEPGPNGSLCSDHQCVDAPGTVVTAADDSQIATSDTPSPPAPDNGTPGHAAEPDLTINTTGTGGTSYSYWSPSTVGLSSTTPPDSGGSTGGNTCGSSSQPACKVELQGTFDAPSLDGDVPTFTEALQQFQTSVASSPVVAGLSTLGAAIPSGGTPPSGSVTLEALGNRTFTLEIPAPVLDAVNSVMPAIMLAVWALISIIVFLRA